MLIEGVESAVPWMQRGGFMFLLDVFFPLYLFSWLGKGLGGGFGRMDMGNTYVYIC